MTQYVTHPGPISKPRVLHSRKTDGAEKGGVGAVSSRAFPKRTCHVCIIFVVENRASTIGPKVVVSCVTHGISKNTVHVAICFRSESCSMAEVGGKLMFLSAPSEFALEAEHTRFFSTVHALQPKHNIFEAAEDAQTPNKFIRQRFRAPS